MMSCFYIINEIQLNQTCHFIVHTNKNQQIIAFEFVYTVNTNKINTYKITTLLLYDKIYENCQFHFIMQGEYTQSYQFNFVYFESLLSGSCINMNSGNIINRTFHITPITPQKIVHEH